MASNKYTLDNLKQFEKDLRQDGRDFLYNIGTYIAIASEDWLKDFTGKTQPAINDREPPRRARRGGWADITGNLANSIFNDVEKQGDSVQIKVGAQMEYASELDEKDGYFVVSGLIDETESPIDQFVEDALQTHIF